MVDVPRMVVFISEEWIPSDKPQEVWDRLLDQYEGDVEVVERASKCFKQQFLADFYIDEVTDIGISGAANGENLVSHRKYRVTVNALTSLITIEKDFLHTIVLDGDFFTLDYCMLTVMYDPYTDTVPLLNWNYSMKRMRGNNSI